MENELRPFWRPYFGFNWKLGFFLLLIICIPRFILVLHANATATYNYIGMIMIISALTPFLFLNSHGRKRIGLTKPQKYLWLVWGFSLGLLFSVLLYFLGESLYNDTIENWYIYIGKSYTISVALSTKDKLILFAIMALVGMTFSPIGEELFFRGIVHSSFAQSFGNTKASLIDSAAFALVHVSHFGLVFLNNQWKFLLFPGLLWVLSMFVMSMVFNICRAKSGSLLGAILSHAAFNLGMMYCIFYFLN